ncbi:ComF family protein [Candidatus Peregrinibacteria bacterium]|nr:ComF family protein [Candidatus Peregrinibacteria bacterium]
MMSFLLDFFFPRRSLLGEEGEWITDTERSLLKASPVVLEGSALKDLGIRSLDRIVAAARYGSSPLLKKAIHTFKYKRIPGLYEDLGRMITHVAPAIDRGDVPVLCPIPLHWTRKFQRGFNQSELLAEVVARERGYPVRSLLRRTRPTGHQAWRNRVERKSALKDAFVASAADVPAFVILIDDLSTTGATLEECAKALRNVGVKRIEGWVVAQG